jgi:PKD repeat protein
MRRFTRLLLPGPVILAITIAGILISRGSQPAKRPTPKPTGTVQAQMLQKMPLYFIQNRGQLDSRVAYYVQGQDKTLYFTKQGLTLALTDQQRGKKATKSKAEKASLRTGIGKESPASRWVVKLDFIGANPNVKITAEEKTPAIISYFKGRPQDWKTSLPTFNRVVYSDLWPGIDLVYSGTVSRLKYSFMVKPGADPDRIQLAYRGTMKVGLDEGGRLQIETPAGRFQDDKPISYQEIAGGRISVETSYALAPGAADKTQTYGFNVGDYDRTKPLIVDPAVLVYAGYIGGTGDDVGRSIAVDSSGNAYVTGYTLSTEASFPATVGPDLTYNGSDDNDAFVAKINTAGSGLVYAGYIGGGGDDQGFGIAVDGSGNAYVTGFTLSTEATFPVTGGPDLTYNGGLYDAFVAKINAAGTALVYCGYIGGNDQDYGQGIAVDGSGNAYVTGFTASTEATFPVTVGPDLTFNGGFDVFVVKVNPAGTALVYCGYIGGSGGADVGQGIAVDTSGNAYVIGYTGSTEATFPVTVGPGLTYQGGPFDGAFDAFVAKVNAAGTALVYCGYIGGTGEDEGFGIAVNSSGEAFVTGRTASTEATFPVIVGPDLTYNGDPSAAFVFDAFVAKVNAAGTALVFSGYIGGNADDEGYGIALPPSFFGQNSAYVTGFTTSTEATFPVTGGPDLTFNGSGDAFVARVSDSGNALIYAGYVGGGGDDFGFGIAVNAPGISSVVFFAHLTGLTNSTEATFPVAVGPDLTYNGANDAFVVKVEEFACTPILISPSTLPDSTTSFFYSQTLTASGGASPHSFAVTSGALPPGLNLFDSKSPDEVFIEGSPTTPGTFTFTITATDDNGCTGSQSYTITIAPCLTLSPPVLPNGVASVPYNQTITASGAAQGPYSFSVTAGSLPPGLTLSGAGVLSGTPTTAGGYSFTVTATNGDSESPCTGSQAYTVTITCPVITVSPATLSNGEVGISYNQSLTASGGTAPHVFTVTSGSPPPGLFLSSGGVLSGTPTIGGIYSFTVTATDANQCTGSRSYMLTITGCSTVTVSPAVLFDGFVGASYRQTLSASGGTGPYTFTRTGGVPPGLNLSAGGVLSGSPTTPGTYSFTVTATDANGCTGSRAYTVTIVCGTLTLSPPTLPSAAIGTAYSQTLTALGGRAPHSFAVTAGALPAGLALSSDGVLSGTPTDAGTSTFTVTATDAAGCSGTATYTVSVCVAALTLSPGALPAATVGTAYGQTLVASGGVPSYAFAVTSGVLPAGLTLSPAGTLSGTPTTAGLFSFVVTATDANGCPGIATYALRVCPVVAIAPSSLPDGSVGTAYSQALTGSGGTGPYTFAASGSVPGLALSSTGVLSGTPTQSGNFSFTVTATDANGCGVTQGYSVRVTDVPPVITDLNLAPADGGNFGLSVTGSGFVNGSVVVVNGVPYPATFVSPTLLTVTLPASAIPTTGTVTVVVTNPGDTGATSNPATLTFCSAPAAPLSPTIEPLGNPTGPITATDYLLVSWEAPATEPAPEFYEFRINGDPWSAPVETTSAIALPRGNNDPITLFVRAHCNAGVSSPAASSPTYSLAPPVANFTFSAARINNPVSFTDTSSPQATSWLWIFDDGGTSILQSPTHTFTTAGTHRVALIASNGSGSSQTIKEVAVSASTSGTGAVISSMRSFETSDGWRWHLPEVAISGDRSVWLKLSAPDNRAETIVYLRFIDVQGQAVLERRLSIAPGQTAVNDVTAYGLEGIYTLEIVASEKIVPLLAHERELLEIERRSLDEP